MQPISEPPMPFQAGRLWLVLAAVCLLLGTLLPSSSVSAQVVGTTGGSGTVAASATGSTVTTVKHHAASHHASFRGTISAVDPNAKSFVVHPKKGSDLTLKVTDKTKYLPKGAGWDDVKVGAVVSGTYHNDGADNWVLTFNTSATTGHHPWPPKSTGTTG